jgi:hypothetical protein
MRVLVACEYSGTVRDAFIAHGHEAISCDLLPTDKPGPHYHGDVFDIIDQKWDLMIAHPPCTFLCNSGVRWLFPKGDLDVERWCSMANGAQFFRALQVVKHIPRKVIENPIMHKYARERIIEWPVQYVQPWQFGHKEMKATGLHLDGVPPLVPTRIVGPPPTDPVERRKWAKVHQAAPGPDRWKLRSTTYAGIADAMASQWGRLS